MTDSFPNFTSPVKSIDRRVNAQGNHKQIDERCVTSIFQVAKRPGLKGEVRQWEHLLRVYD